MAIILFAAVYACAYLIAKKTCLKTEKHQTLLIKILSGVGLLLSIGLIFVMFRPIIGYLQASMWIALAPFAICLAMSVIYLVKTDNKKCGILALVTVPLQMIVLWSLVFNKVLIFYAKPEFNILNGLFTVTELLILFEAFVLNYTYFEKVEWTRHIDKMLQESMKEYTKKHTYLVKAMV